MSDLDDFFAKKSRKKKTKNSSAVLAGDLLNQKKEQEVRKQRKLKEKDDKSNEPLSALLKKTVDDDEWNDVEAEREPTAADLSRIQNLTISRTSEQTRDGEDRNNVGAENEDHTREEVDRQGAAWGVTGADQPNGSVSDEDSRSTDDRETPSKEPSTSMPVARESQAISETPAEAEAPKAAPTKAYVAPHLRNRSSQNPTGEYSLGGSSDFSSGRKFIKKVKAPDIGNVDEFPTLGGNARNEGNSTAADNAGGRGFTKVQHSGTASANTRSGYPRHGGRSEGGKNRGGESLTLENRYATLSDDC